MFRERSAGQYDDAAEAGVRHLFSLGEYVFQDTQDAEGVLRHFVSSTSDDSGNTSFFEMDTPVVYEFMARFLAGEYELREFEMEHSPAHDELLDILEILTARARAGEAEFSWDEFDPAETEVLDEGDDEESDNG
jgi:hypothetical protein